MQPERKKIAFILGFFLLVIAVIVGWQIAGAYISNEELQTDMNDLAAQPGARVGLASPNTEDELRRSIINRAKDHGIQLDPEQVTAEIKMTPETWTINLAADYKSPVSLLVFSVSLHFTPSSARDWPVKRD